MIIINWEWIPLIVTIIIYILSLTSFKLELYNLAYFLNTVGILSFFTSLIIYIVLAINWVIHNIKVI